MAEAPTTTPFSGSTLTGFKPLAELTREGQILLGVLEQCERTEWWTPERMQAQHFKLLGKLLTHCLETVPFYGDQFASYKIDDGRPLTAETWSKIPILKRTDVQTHGKQFVSTADLAKHGSVSERSTSGSTGRPLVIQTTALATLYARACAVRFMTWHDYDMTAKIANMRGRISREKYPNGFSNETWGKPYNLLFETGPSAGISSVTPVSEVVAWLQRESPDYLVSHGHEVDAMARYCLEHKITVPQLRSLSTYGGVVRAPLRALCKQAWGIPLRDVYSAEEVGCIAIQCPDHDHYHIQAENAYVEILDDKDQLCRPGELGRVVVTPLHNYLTPLLRYEIGDCAIPGTDCFCGRGLPVLTEIAGRTRDMLTIPSGGIASPAFVNGVFQTFPVLQFQVIQHAPDRLEAKIVRKPDYTTEMEPDIRRKMHEKLPANYDITFSYHEEIPRETGGKYLDFISKLSPYRAES